MAKLKLDDIINVTFHKASFGGYKPEDVEVFIDDVEETVSYLLSENKRLVEELDKLKQQNNTYETEEDSIKLVLVRSQKLANETIQEAENKAKEITEEANEKAENIVKAANDEILSYSKKMEDMKHEVVKFRATLLNLYKEHLKLIDAIPKNIEFDTIAEEKNSDGYEDEDVGLTESDKTQGKTHKIEESIKAEMCGEDDTDENSDEFLDKYTDDISDFLTESRTIKFDAIKFGNDYDSFLKNEE